jgi:chitodextrinase
MGVATTIYGGGSVTINMTVASGVTPRGEYDAEYAYVTGDSCSYEGSSYIAIQNTTGNLPTDTTYWQLLAEGAGEDVITSTPTSGEFKVVDIHMDADEKVVIKYNDTAED